MTHALLPVAILAGGLATRLRPVTETLPKALIPVNGEPFICHQLRLLHKQGVRQVVLCLGYLGEMVEQVVGDGSQFGLEVKYSYDTAAVIPRDVLCDEGSPRQGKLLGTAGAIKKALPLLDESFFVLYGDSYLTCDYAAVQQSFLASGKQAQMTVFHNEGQWDTSNVEYQHGQLLAYSKQDLTDRMHYIDYGLGMFQSSSFELVPADTAYDLALLYEALLKNNQLAGFEVNQRFYEVGSFAGIDEFEYYLAALPN